MLDTFFTSVPTLNAGFQMQNEVVGQQRRYDKGSHVRFLAAQKSIYQKVLLFPLMVRFFVCLCFKKLEFRTLQRSEKIVAQNATDLSKRSERER